jgi:hypothetical protein
MGYFGLRGISEYGTLVTSNPPVGGSNPSEGTISAHEIRVLVLYQLQQEVFYNFRVIFRITYYLLQSHGPYSDPCDCNLIVTNPYLIITSRP